MNSHAKSKGIVFDGVEKISASADGTTIEHIQYNKSTGNVIEAKVKDSTTGKTYRRSGSAIDNQIEFHQNTNGAFITVSGSNPGFNIIDTDGQYALFRGHSILMMSESIWQIGVSTTNDTFMISRNSVLSGGAIELPRAHNSIQLSGSSELAVGVTGSMSVDGTLSATRKSFDIQHPTKPDKRLVYGSLEGPEFGVYIRGKVEGDNKIEMPEYWTELVNMDTLSVHLTAINSKNPIYFTFSDNKYIYINREAHFYYMVCAERKDIDRLQVEQ